MWFLYGLVQLAVRIACRLEIRLYNKASCEASVNYSPASTSPCVYLKEEGNTWGGSKISWNDIGMDSRTDRGAHAAESTWEGKGYIQN